jgi:hypothetical protein
VEEDEDLEATMKDGKAVTAAVLEPQPSVAAEPGGQKETA